MTGGQQKYISFCPVFNRASANEFCYNMESLTHLLSLFPGSVTYNFFALKAKVSGVSCFDRNEIICFIAPCSGGGGGTPGAVESGALGL